MMVLSVDSLLASYNSSKPTSVGLLVIQNGPLGGSEGVQ